ncbi:hypothetical protein D3C77_513650 [compost metagenome]
MRLYSFRMLIRHMLYDREQSVEALLRFSGKEHNWCISHEQEMIADFLFKLMHRFVVLLYNVPFVDDEHGSFPRLIGITGDMLILLDDPFLAINQNEHDIRPLNRFHSAHHTVFLRRFVHLAAFAHSSGIDKHVTLPILLERRIDRIAGRSGEIADDNPFLT